MMMMIKLITMTVFVNTHSIFLSRFSLQSYLLASINLNCKSTEKEQRKELA